MNNSITKTYANKTSNSISNGYQTTKNTAVKTYNSFLDASLFAKFVIITLIIIFIVLFILWIRYLYQQSQYKLKESPFIITQPINAFKSSGEPVLEKKVPFPVDGLAFSYSLWIYVADWNYNFGNWKNIFLKGTEMSRAPGMWLYPKTNSLHARITTTADGNEGCDINNIPLQKWVHIAYILNNRTVDIYIDGKLERSCVLRGVPILNNNSVSVANDGGFYGQIAKMQYFTRALIPSEVSEIYSEGPYVATSKFSLFSTEDDKKE